MSLLGISILDWIKAILITTGVVIALPIIFVGIVAGCCLGLECLRLLLEKI
jgi:hypothetical protein